MNRTDERYMLRAMSLATRGAGYASPNPMVGAVLVHESRIIGKGWHHRCGDVHAEVDCLQNVAESDRHLIPQSTMYVTLEPCAHQGRQPPCAHRLAAEGIPQVVIALEDPFVEVAGRGIAILREAGIEVSIGLCGKEARWMCRRFLAAQERARPYIILKWAQSADGFMAPADGRRMQLSNYFSQTLVHRWRREEAAIMVGYNTALADNPQLTSRYWGGPQPLRIALDRHLQLPQSHHLFDGSTPTWIINELKNEGSENRRLMRFPFDEHLLPALLQRLVEEGRNSLFVEGGAKLLHSFISAGLWDEARVFHTPAMWGTGIAAPAITNASSVFSTGVGRDILQLIQPAASRYPYPAGAEL